MIYRYINCILLAANVINRGPKRTLVPIPKSRINVAAINAAKDHWEYWYKRRILYGSAGRDKFNYFLKCWPEPIIPKFKPFISSSLWFLNKEMTNKLFVLI